MRQSQGDGDPVGDPSPASLTHNFAWTFAGNALLGASQWAVLSLLARLGSAEMLGQYALALAVTSPITMLSHLNLRAVLATDMEQRHAFGDYLSVRVATTAMALVALTLMALLAGYPPAVAGSIILLALSLSADNLSDIFYAALQRKERMSTIARSMMVRGLLSLTALAVVLWMTRSLVPAVAAFAAGRLAVLFAYDVPKGSSGENLSRSGWRDQRSIFRTALPLGLVLMLVSLTSNVPRYAVESFLGTRELGAFAAVAAFLTAGSTVANALGQAATPRLARLFCARDLGVFRRLAWKLTGLAVLLGAAGAVLAVWAGGLVLGLVYSAAFEAYAGVLVQIMLSAIFVYVAVVLGYVITSARSFLAQLPLLVIVTLVSAAMSRLLVPRMGLSGAAVAVAAAASVQIAGEVLILRRALGRAERA